MGKGGQGNKGERKKNCQWEKKKREKKGARNHSKSLYEGLAGAGEENTKKYHHMSQWQREEDFVYIISDSLLSI